MAKAQARVPGVEARAGKFPGPSLIPALQAIQERLGWLPREELVTLSREVRRPLYEIEGLISFYPHFLTEPPKTVTLQICHDLTCWLQGADERIAALRERYGDENEIEFAEVSCIGRCDAAPAVAVNECPASADDADALITAAKAGRTVEPARFQRGYGGAPRPSDQWPSDQWPSDQWPNDPYRPGQERYQVLRALLSGDLDPGRLIATVADSGLRGMGGAGFPTGRKWELVAAQAATPKYAICNADESEPGTFKDRQILAEQPHLVLEGLLLGMAAVGAEEGWVFIRHEYGPEQAVVRREIESLRAAGLAGENVAGTGRRLLVEVFTSPGGYILGEESALIECMEGHRGEPRNKPPFPGVYGLWGRPTLMNSVETFAHVPIIAQRGADWWKRQGVGSGSGLKFFAVSGHVERPGWIARDAVHAGHWERSSRAAPRRTSSGPTSSTCRLTSTRWPRPGPCSARVPWWCWPRAPTCSPRPRTCCASSATSRAASAFRAGSDPPRRTRYSPTCSPAAEARPR
jgi:formate dehydrogenase beta subunit